MDIIIKSKPTRHIFIPENLNLMATFGFDHSGVMIKKSFPCFLHILKACSLNT